MSRMRIVLLPLILLVVRGRVQIALNNKSVIKIQKKDNNIPKLQALKHLHKYQHYYNDNIKELQDLISGAVLDLRFRGIRI